MHRFPDAASGAETVPGHCGGGVPPARMTRGVGAVAKRNPKEIDVMVKPASAAPVS
jgi:hypothetical protein